MKIGDLRKNQLEVLISLSWILPSVAQVVPILVIIINKQNTKKSSSSSSPSPSTNKFLNKKSRSASPPSCPTFPMPL
jgi:hypothetical protein